MIWWKSPDLISEEEKGSVRAAQGGGSSKRNSLSESAITDDLVCNELSPPNLWAAFGSTEMREMPVFKRGPSRSRLNIPEFKNRLLDPAGSVALRCRSRGALPSAPVSFQPRSILPCLSCPPCCYGSQARQCSARWRRLWGAGLWKGVNGLHSVCGCTSITR